MTLRQYIASQKVPAQSFDRSLTWLFHKGLA